MSAQRLVRETVNGDIDDLTRTDARKLRFLVVRDHVNLWERHDIDEVPSDSDIIAELNLTFADHAIKRRKNAGVTQSEARGSQSRFGAIEIRGTLLLRPLEHLELVVLLGDGRATGACVCLRFTVSGSRLLKALPRACISLRQSLLPFLLLAC